MRKPRKPNREEVVTPKAEELPSQDQENAAPASKKQAKRKPAPAASPAAEAMTACQAEPQATSATQQTEEASQTAAKQEIPAVQAEAFKILTSHTLAAGGVSCLPIPGADVLGMTAIQANMIEEISRIHGHVPTPGWSMRLAGLFLVSVGFLDVGKLALTSMAKLFPGAGTIIGIGGTAAYAAASTYALGKSIDSYYAQGGKPEHLVYSSLISSTKSLMTEGREYWKQLLLNRKKRGQQQDATAAC